MVKLHKYAQIVNISKPQITPTILKKSSKLINLSTGFAIFHPLGKNDCRQIGCYGSEDAKHSDGY